VGQAIPQGDNLNTGVIAIIPARSGSKGVPDKNIRLLGNHPLIAYSIAAAKLSGIERVLVSTDSKKYAEIAEKYGAEVPFLRPTELAADQSTDLEFMQHAMDWFRDTHSFVPEFWVHLRPTTPLRNPKKIVEALKYIEANSELDSLRSAHAAEHSPFKWFLKDKQGLFKGIKKYLTPELINKPRQDFPKVYIPNGYVDVIKYSRVKKYKSLHGSKMYIFETEEINEIDKESDFDYMSYILQKNIHHLALSEFLNESNRV